MSDKKYIQSITLPSTDSNSTAGQSYTIKDPEATAAITALNQRVPTPTSSDTNKFLKGDGTWAEVSGADGNATYSLTQDSQNGHKLIWKGTNVTQTTFTIPDNNTTHTLGSSAKTDGFDIYLSHQTGAGPARQTTTVPLVSTNTAGLVPQLDGNATHFLNSTGGWTVPNGTGTADTNTTYTLDISTGNNSTLKLTDSNGVISSVTIPNTTNTTYGIMSTDEGVTGTATSNRVLTAKNLKSIIEALDTDTTYTTFSSSNGGLVPAPTAAEASGNYFLQANGNWATVSSSGGGGGNTYSLTQDPNDGHKLYWSVNGGTPSTFTIPDANSSYNLTTQSGGGYDLELVWDGNGTSSRIPISYSLSIDTASNSTLKLIDSNGITSSVTIPNTTNTTYGSMSSTEGITGTATSNRVLTAKNLKDIVNNLTSSHINVQSDWNVTATNSDAFIKNKPTIPTIPGTFTTAANGLVPKPAAAATNTYLNSCGQWTTISSGSADGNDTYSLTQDSTNKSKLIWKGTNVTQTTYILPNTTYNLSISTAANSTLHLLSGASTLANITIPNTTNTTYNTATTNSNGLMSAQDKIDLNNCLVNTFLSSSNTTSGYNLNLQSYNQQGEAVDDQNITIPQASSASYGVVKPDGTANHYLNGTGGWTAIENDTVPIGTILATTVNTAPDLPGTWKKVYDIGSVCDNVIYAGTFIGGNHQDEHNFFGYYASEDGFIFSVHVPFIREAMVLNDYSFGTNTATTVQGEMYMDVDSAPSIRAYTVNGQSILTCGTGDSLRFKVRSVQGDDVMVQTGPLTTASHTANYKSQIGLLPSLLPPSKTPMTFMIKSNGAYPFYFPNLKYYRWQRIS